MRRALLGAVVSCMALLAARAEARCLPLCQCPQSAQWAAQGRVRQATTDGGADERFELVVTEVTSFGAALPPQIGAVLPLLGGFAFNSFVLRLSGGETYQLVDGMVVCSSDRIPLQTFVNAVPNETRCRQTLADAGFLQPRPCNDVGLGCSSTTAAPALALLVVASALRRRRSPTGRDAGRPDVG